MESEDEEYDENGDEDHDEMNKKELPEIMSEPHQNQVPNEINVN